MSVLKSKIDHAGKKYSAFSESLVFFSKAALAQTIVQIIFGHVLIPHVKWTSGAMFMIPIWWLSHASVYYPYSYLLHSLYERDTFKDYRVKRPRHVPKQTMEFTLAGLMQGECIGLAMLVGFQQWAAFNGMTDDDNFLPPLSFYELCRSFAWFFFCMWSADIMFYITHFLFHEYSLLYKIHKKHHSFKYQVAWSAEVKTVTESIIVSTTDLLPHLLFGGHISYLLAWVVVGTLFNIEGP